MAPSEATAPTVCWIDELTPGFNCFLFCQKPYNFTQSRRKPSSTMFFFGYRPSTMSRFGLAQSNCCESSLPCEYNLRLHLFRLSCPEFHKIRENKEMLSFCNHILKAITAKGMKVMKDGAYRRSYHTQHLIKRR